MFRSSIQNVLNVLDGSLPVIFMLASFIWFTSVLFILFTILIVFIIYCVLFLLLAISLGPWKSISYNLINIALVPILVTIIQKFINVPQNV